MVEHSENVKNKLFSELEAVADGETQFQYVKRDFPSWHNRYIIWAKKETREKFKFFGSHSKIYFKNYNDVLEYLIELGLKSENLNFTEENEEKATEEDEEGEEWQA